MTERVDEIRDGAGHVIARVVYNPNQIPESVPYWIELADGYEVYHGKQACHDRSEATRLPKGVK